MKSDINGCSMCKKGHENYEQFKSSGKNYIQYDYRRSDGELFSCVAKTLENARARRDNWLKSQ